MLNLKPTEPIYFLVQERGVGIVKAHASFILTDDGSIKIRILESKHLSEEFREVVLTESHTSACVYIHDSDTNHRAYITFFSDTSDICIDAGKEILILRERLLEKCNYQPIWREWK